MKNMCLKIFLLMLCSVCLTPWAFGQAQTSTEDISLYSELYDGMITNEPEQEVTFTYRTKTADNRLKDINLTELKLNGKKITPYGKTYKFVLAEGENVITTQLKDDGYDINDTFTVYCDTSKPSVHIKGIHDYMMVDQTKLEFSVVGHDNVTPTESIETKVHFGGKVIKNKNGLYTISPKKKAWNSVDVIVKDLAGNTYRKTLHLIYYPIDATASELISDLVDYVPTLGVNIEESTGVTKGKTSEIGTFGGYVVLKTDKNLKNINGFDFAVKGSWNNDGPLYSVAVMQDSNGNGLPDESNWYYLSDEETKKHKDEPEWVSYIKDPDHDNVGYINLDSGDSFRVEASSSDHVFVEDLNHTDMEFDEFIDLYGILKKDSTHAKSGTFTKENRYELETGINADGQSFVYSTVDFIKVYANSILITEDGYPLSASVSSVRFLSPTELTEQGQETYDHTNFPFYFTDQSLSFDKPFSKYKVGDVVTVTYEGRPNIVATGLMARKKFFYERYDRQTKKNVRDSADTTIAVTKVADNTFSFVMPDTPVDITPRLTNTDKINLFQFVNQYKDITEEEMIPNKIAAINRMESLYEQGVLSASSGDKEILENIFSFKDNYITSKLIDRINNWSYDVDELAQIKYEFDLLPLSKANDLSEEVLIKLDQAILSVVDQSIEEGFLVESKVDVEYVYGLGLSLSKQDVERGVIPKLKLKFDSEQEASLTFYKDSRKQSDFAIVNQYKINK